MRYTSQNLSDGKQHAFWWGRARLYLHGHTWLHTVRWEWCFGRACTTAALTLVWGKGSEGAGVMLHVALPLMFSLYLNLDGLWHTKERELGLAYHSQALWLCLFADCWDHRSGDKWYAKTHCWRMPWGYKVEQTEILSPDLKSSRWCERHNGLLKRYWLPEDQARAAVFDALAAREVAEKTNSVALTYTYITQKGQVQVTAATAYASRRTVRMRGWPLFFGRKVRTEFWLSFAEAIGESVDGYAGGVTGCGGTLKPGQTLIEAVREMEATRKFER